MTAAEVTPTKNAPRPSISSSSSRRNSVHVGPLGSPHCRVEKFNPIGVRLNERRRWSEEYVFALRHISLVEFCDNGTVNSSGQSDRPTAQFVIPFSSGKYLLLLVSNAVHSTSSRPVHEEGESRFGQRNCSTEPIHQ